MISPNIDYFGYMLVVWVRDLIVAILLEYFQHYFHKYLFKLGLMNTKPWNNIFIYGYYFWFGSSQHIVISFDGSEIILLIRWQNYLK